MIDSIQTIGKALNKEEAAEAHITRIRKVVKEIKEDKNTPKKVLLSIGLFHINNKSYIAGAEKYFSGIMALSKAENCYKGKIQYPIVSLEGVASMKPDVILIIKPGITEEQKKKELGWWKKFKFIKAVKNNKVIILTENHLTLPGAELDKTIKSINKALK